MSVTRNLKTSHKSSDIPDSHSSIDKSMEEYEAKRVDKAVHAEGDTNYDPFDADYLIKKKHGKFRDNMPRASTKEPKPWSRQT